MCKAIQAVSYEMENLAVFPCFTLPKYAWIVLNIRDIILLIST
jgi:hypothetical protein